MAIYIKPKNKRAKRAALIKYKEVTHIIYSVRCPHCKVEMIGDGFGFDEHTLMFICDFCKGIIDLRPERKNNN